MQGLGLPTCDAVQKPQDMDVQAVNCHRRWGVRGGSGIKKQVLGVMNRRRKRQCSKSALRHQVGINQSTTQAGKCSFVGWDGCKA